MNKKIKRFFYLIEFTQHHSDRPGPYSMRQKIDRVIKTTYFRSYYFLLHFDLIFINSHLFFPFSDFNFIHIPNFFLILSIFPIFLNFIYVLNFILFYPYSQFYFILSIFSILFCPYFQFSNFIHIFNFF